MNINKQLKEAQLLLDFAEAVDKDKGLRFGETVVKIEDARRSRILLLLLEEVDKKVNK